jgi:hypothetical protein
VNLAACAGTQSSGDLRQNLPYDKHGCVDWKKLRERQLRGYSTADLEAEIARRREGVEHG